MIVEAVAPGSDLLLCETMSCIREGAAAGECLEARLSAQTSFRRHPLVNSLPPPPLAPPPHTHTRPSYPSQSSGQSRAPCLGRLHLERGRERQAEVQRDDRGGRRLPCGNQKPCCGPHQLLRSQEYVHRAAQAQEEAGGAGGLGLQDWGLCQWICLCAGPRARRRPVSRPLPRGLPPADARIRQARCRHCWRLLRSLSGAY